MHSIWAVAKNTLAQAIRMKIAVVVFFLLLILLPLMSVIMKGDGTLVGKLQTFSSYGLALISFLLCILTIAISTFTLSNDLKRKYIFLVATKPIRRAELILGKLIGVFLLNVILLAVFGTILYSCTILIPRFTDAPREQIIRAQYEFFTSRIGLTPKMDTDKIQKRALERLNELEKTNQIPETMSKNRAFQEILGQERMREKSVAPGQVKEWEFQDIKLKNPGDPNTILFIRYKYQTTINPPDDQVFGAWRIGDMKQLQYETDRPKTPIWPYEQKQAIRTIHEFPVPGAVVTAEGQLTVSFYNDPSMNRTTIIPEELEVLYRTGTFTENYFRSLLMILVQLIFLTIMGITLSTWMSFPVAILVCFVVFFTGLTNGFIIDAIEGLGVTAGIIYSFTVKPLLWMLPQFDGKFNPTGYIVDGRTLRWTFLITTTGITIFFKGVLLLLFGMFVFSRREVAKAVV